MLACSAMVACTNEDPIDNGTENGKEKLEQSYISVKLVNPSARSRAFADGNETEMTVSRARFYLFNSDNSAYIIEDGTNNENFVDVSSDDLTPNYNSSGNVETICNAVLVINRSTKQPPTSIVAVLNYPLNDNSECVWGNGAKSLDDLKNATLAYNHGTIKSGASSYNTSGNFVMTNSVYVDGTNTVMEATPIAPENICITPGNEEGDNNGALQHPVEIYVERIAAKVEASMSNEFTPATDNSGTYTIKAMTFNQINENGVSEEVTVNARVLGWKVTNITEKSYLIKHLTNSYTTFNDHTGAATSWTWNDAGNFRSYWANTSDLSTPTHPWTFNEVTNNFDEENNWEYYNENTHPSIHSQLLVVAQFEVEGEPTPIAEWYGVKYTYAGLQTAIANALKKKVYTRTGAEGNYVYTSVTPAEITFEQVSHDLDAERYWAEAKLTGTPSTYYNENQVAYTEETLATLLETIQHAKIWGNYVTTGEGDAAQRTVVGGGYYYVDIIQNAGTVTRNEEGTVTSDANIYGLVRNHWYQLTLNGLSGLGTPVYDPEKIIKTEKPDGDESYIAAEINVLAWNIKQQSVTLE